jgi:hypothetical protein
LLPSGDWIAVQLCRTFNRNYLRDSPASSTLFALKR